MSDTLFPTPEGQKAEPAITRYAPAEWIDEFSPAPQADPNAFLKQKDGKWFLMPTEDDLKDTGSYCIAAAHGDLIEFDSFRDYGSGTLSVREGGGWTIDFVYPLDANTFYVDNDPYTVMDSVDEIIRSQAEADPAFWSPSYETDINVSFWGDRTTFRVVIEGDTARLEKLPEPPLTLPYTNWRGETAIRNIRPISVKFTATSWHKEPQWILEAYDYDRQEMRGFAMRDFRTEPFQKRVDPWMQACFGAEISADKLERGDRLIEEVLELLQAVGYPRERIAALTDYTWAKPPGEPAQEVGGTMLTLAAFCLAHGFDMHENGETELARVWTKVEQIRAKQAAKPTGSALPQAWPTEDESNG